jgi:DNA-binding GntR family transcriptional regulator
MRALKTDPISTAGRSSERVEKTAFERAYDAILDLIVRQKLRPGEKTSVVALSEELGIGRTPTKEAITRLATEGILSVEGRRGTYVTRLGEEDVRHIFALRRLFEHYAAPLAAQNMDRARIGEMERLLKSMEEASLRREPGRRSMPHFVNSDVKFHNLLIEAAGNPYLYAQYCALHLHQQIVTYLFHSSRRSAEDRQREHVAILDALKRRDAKALRHALAEHTGSVEETIIGSIREMRGEPASEKQRPPVKART